MIPPKIILGDSERAFIFNERKATGLSAEYVSEQIGRSKSWLGQIENGRAKKINRIDLINLIAFLRKDTDLTKIEGYIHTYMYAITNKLSPPSSPDDEKVNLFIDNNDYSEKGSEESFEEYKDGINKIFQMIFEKNSNKKQTVDMMANIFSNFVEGDAGLTFSIMSLPFRNLRRTSSAERNKFMKELYDLIDKYGQDTDFELIFKENFKD